jgi:hypothetical protein
MSSDAVFDPVRPPYSGGVVGTCLAFGFIALIEAHESGNGILAALGCGLMGAGVIAFLLQYRAKQRDQRRAEQEDNSPATR